MRKINIVFIIIDALRAKNLGCYGYHKNTSPNLDALAQEGILFENAYATINTTDPSLTSIFSGKYPRNHGIIHHGEKILPKEIETFYKKGTRLLPEMLKDFGYTTLAIDWMGRWHKKGYDRYESDLASGTVKVVPFLFQLSQKLPLFFQKLLRKIYRATHSKLPEQLQEKIKGPNAKKITKKGIDLIKEYPDHPWFLFLHYWDIHAPYFPPKEFKKKFKSSNPKEKIVSVYDGLISYVDQEIGKIISSLKKSHNLDNTLIIVTSDHGENLGDHGIENNHHTLYEEIVRVPLIIRFPQARFRGSKVKALIQHIDLLPTVLDLIGAEHPPGIDGKSLLPLIKKGQKESFRKEVFMEENYQEKKRAIRSGDFKYIWASSKKEAKCRHCGIIHGGVKELYDLKKDPGENLNIAKKEPGVTQALNKKIREFFKE